MVGAKPIVLVIVGISGDLSRRYLLPALSNIMLAGQLPNSFKLLGITRQELKPEDFVTPATSQELLKQVELYNMELDEVNDYKKLYTYLQKITAELGAQTEILFYLSIPPQLVRQVVELLGTSGLAKDSRVRILLEKPFGVDLGSATELVETTAQYFNENQVYRIDHYLAKEMTQNLLVFRESNTLFKRTWNSESIEAIDIIMSEQIGIEGRVNFYEQTGALRDVVQSHLLQLAALVLMPATENMTGDEISKARLQALRQLYLLDSASWGQQVKRGQYSEYRTEVNNKRSTTETFVSLAVGSSDPRWHNVPIRLIAGKALDKRTTEIRITYKKIHSHESNGLTLKIQPDEGVELTLITKRPGFEKEIDHRALKFTYSDHYSALPGAYERVLVDAFRGERGLFLHNLEVLESWRILQPIIHQWSLTTDDLVFYDAGTSWHKLV